MLIPTGKFHGVIIPTTPIGCLIVTIRAVGNGDGIVWPITRRPSSADQSQNEAEYATSPRDSVMGLPFSAVISVAELEKSVLNTVGFKLLLIWT